MFKIGEFSKLTQVTIRMLRYYDEAGLLKPAFIDPWTGYRMYTADQIPVLNKIVYLRDSGFNVAEIRAAIQTEDQEQLAAQLHKKYGEIQQNILAEQAKLKNIETAQQALLGGGGGLHYQITIKSVPSFQVLSLRRVIPDYYAEGELWHQLSAFAAQRQIAVSHQTFSIYHDPEYREQNVDVELCVPVDQADVRGAEGQGCGGRGAQGFTYRRTEAVPFMASTMVYGPFSNIAGAYLSFAGWLQDSGRYKMGSTSRQIVHRGPWNEDDPQCYLTELQIPLEHTEV